MLVNYRQDIDVTQKEVFGPVLPVVTFNDLDEAIAYANDTVVGLTLSSFTININTALRAYDELYFGETYVNRENFEAMQGFHAGHGRSGIGGTDGKHGVYEYTKRTWPTSSTTRATGGRKGKVVRSWPDPSATEAVTVVSGLRPHPR